MTPAARLRSPQFWFVLLLTAALLGAAHLAAEWRATQERPLLHHRFQAGDLYASGVRMGAG